MNYDKPFFREYMEVCTDGFRMNWHESNGGNLSYLLTSDEVQSVCSDFEENDDWITLGVQVPNLSGKYFLVSGSGVYFSEVEKFPEKSLNIIQINGDGNAYRILLNKDRVKPTSEIAAHLISHEMKVGSGSANRCVYHAHTTNLIALTFVLPLESKVFTEELWRMASECAVLFPEGVGVLSWMVPGADDIANRTADLMATKNIVVWANHGTFCSAESPRIAFGLMNAVEKAAEILIKVLSTNRQVLQSITDENLDQLAERFNVTLNKER